MRLRADNLGMEGLAILGIIVLVVLTAVVIFVSWQAAKKRREALAALAAELGWQFTPSHDRSHDDEYAHFEIFRRGHSRSAYNTLWGPYEIDGHIYPAKMGDFLYKVTSSNGKSTSTTTYRFSYLILHLPWGVPNLFIRREGLFDKLAGLIGFDDIDFESAEFSKKFLVKSPDKRFAYDVIDPRMIEFLLETNPPVIDIEHSRLSISDGRSTWTPEGFLAQLRFAEAFFSRWPRHVVDSLESSR